MIFSFSVNVTFSDADKKWLDAHAVTPIVGALNGIRDAIIDQQQALAGFAELKAKFDSIDPPTEENP